MQNKGIRFGIEGLSGGIKNCFFTFGQKGGGSRPIQKILIRKNWNGQSLNGGRGNLGRAGDGDGEQRLAPTL